MSAKRDKPADSYPDNPWPLLIVLAIVAVGVVLAALGFWRRASLVIAAALGLGSVLRLVLPRSMAGLLVVRRRWIDAAVMVMLGVSIAVFALLVPPAR